MYHTESTYLGAASPQGVREGEKGLLCTYIISGMLCDGVVFSCL